MAAGWFELPHTGRGKKAGIDFTTFSILFPAPGIIISPCPKNQKPCVKMGCFSSPPLIKSKAGKPCRLHINCCSIPKYLRPLCNLSVAATSLSVYELPSAKLFVIMSFPCRFYCGACVLIIRSVATPFCRDPPVRKRALGYPSESFSVEPSNSSYVVELLCILPASRNRVSLVLYQFLLSKSQSEESRLC